MEIECFTVVYSSSHPDFERIRQNAAEHVGKDNGVTAMSCHDEISRVGYLEDRLEQHGIGYAPV